MTIPELYCPLCGNNVESVDLERFEREGKPQAVRCLACHKGWEVIDIGNKLLMSQAPSYDKPELKVVTIW